MSIFNEEKLLPELLTSVFQQSGVIVRWWIRDDGSTDSRRETLTDASSQIEPISVVPVPPKLPKWEPCISLKDGLVAIKAESQEDGDGNR
jgi:hypothetical protein